MYVSLNTILKTQLGLSSVLIAGFLFSIDVAAQNSSSMTIEEIVVTAEKRETNLQDTALAITAFTQAELDRQNIIGLLDMADKVPGLTINSNNGNNLIVTVRGIGYEANVNQQSVQGVALHQDGVFLPQVSSLNASMLDSQRIEVLRGPQGTVFGQNSTGGVINIISNPPELGEFSGKVDMTVGNHGTFRPRVVANVPLGETAALRVAGEYYTHSGYAEVVGTSIAGFDLDEKDDFSGRVSLLWEPTSNLSLNFRAQHYEFDGHDVAQRNIDDPSGDKRKVTHGDESFTRSDQTVISGTIEWELPWATVKSITAWSDASISFSRDNDVGDASFITDRPQAIIVNSFREGKTITQELNIASNSEGPLEWLVGGFYMDADNNGGVFEFFDLNFDGSFATTDASTATSPFGPFDIPGLPDELNFQSTAPADRTSYSAYGQVTWSVTDDWRLIGGLRYTDDKIDAFVTTYLGIFGPGNLFTSQVEKVTWKVGTQYDFSEDIMGYFTISTGLKPGGINLLTAVAAGSLIDNEFGEEEVLAYEVGLKSRFADGRFQLNVAAFYYDYTDFQFHTENFAPFTGGVGNAPELEIYGAEFEFSGLLTERLRFDANVTLLEGEVTGSHIALSPTAAARANRDTFAAGSFLFSGLNFGLRGAEVADLQGNTPAKLPSLSFNLDLSYDHDISNLGVLSSTISYIYKGAYDYTIFNEPGLGNPEYDLINLHFGFQPQNYENWSAELIIQNLENDDAINARWTNIFGTGATADQYVPPRLVLFRLGYEF